MPETKTASGAPEKKVGTEALTSTAKMGGENVIPTPKAPVSSIFLFVCVHHLSV